jgi:HEAT repeat protein
MLKSHDYEDIYRALGAIGKGKLKKALPYLKNIALYDEDQGIQEEAIRTIRKIGGRKAFEILRFLKTTEHRDLVQQMLDLKHIEDIDAY